MATTKPKAAQIAYVGTLATNVQDAIQEVTGSDGASYIGYTPAGTNVVNDVQSQLRGSNTTPPSDVGFFNDGLSGANIHRFKDRVFVGDAANYSGNRSGANGYGASWTTTKGASYLIKNATMAVSSLEIDQSNQRRYGLIGFSKSMGVGAVSVNDGTGTYARGLYAEAFHQSADGASGGIEIQVGNYTNILPSVNPYNFSNVRVVGLALGVESGIGYTVGDADTPISPALNPAGCAIDISGGSIEADYQKWVSGIVFRHNAIVRDPQKSTATAIHLARKHSIVWAADNSNPVSAFIRSDVTTQSGLVGIIFDNNKVRVTGVSDRTICEFVDDTVGAGVVNYSTIKASRTNVPITFGVAGTDTNVHISLQSKGNGGILFKSHDGSGENFRVSPSSVAATDFLSVTGSAGGGNAQLNALGASADIDIIIGPKGTGVLRFGTWSSNADTAINGYVTIKDSSGTIRRLATI